MIASEVPAVRATVLGSGFGAVVASDCQTLCRSELSRCSDENSRRKGSFDYGGGDRDQSS